MSGKRNLPEIEKQPGRPFGATWLITAPWAHAVWQQYLLLLYDLTTIMEGPKTVKHRPDVTHEMMLYALDPSHPVVPGFPLHDQKPSMLTPANYGYQFTVANHGESIALVQGVVDLIEARELSPDTDFVRAWDEMMIGTHGAVSLRKR